MKKLAVFVSGNGSNLQAIIDNINNNQIDGKIEIVISNKKDAYALKRAENNGIEALYISKNDFSTIIEYEQYLIKILKEKSIDIIVLAGFLYIFSETFIDQFQNKIINIHPSLLPSFGGKGMYGLNVHKAVIEYGAKITGATVHFVDKTPDGGPIILQKAIYVDENDTPETLQQKVLTKAEWVILPIVLKLLCKDKIKIKGRKVIIEDKEILKEVDINV
ncbi:phosphoribosylglycinamide formyltransferase [Caldicellulosiruptoraceae bacterium PP1]